MSSLCSTCVAGHLSGKNAPTFLSIAPCRRPEGALLVIASQRRGHVCLTIGRRRRLPSRETVDRLAKRRNRRVRSPRLRQPDHDQSVPRRNSRRNPACRPSGCYGAARSGKVNYQVRKKANLPKQCHKKPRRHHAILPTRAKKMQKAAWPLACSPPMR